MPALSRTVPVTTVPRGFEGEACESAPEPWHTGNTIRNARAELPGSPMFPHSQFFPTRADYVLTRKCLSGFVAVSHRLIHERRSGCPFLHPQRWVADPASARCTPKTGSPPTAQQGISRAVSDSLLATS